MVNLWCLHQQATAGTSFLLPTQAHGNTVVIRCGMVATFGGMWREVVAVSIALV
jgi:hypothetical protein